MNPIDKIFKHYKGKHYKVLNIGYHTETSKKLVIYEQLYENDYPYGYVWCRPYNMFFGEIKYENKNMKRFQQIEEILN